jgi:hypothetical protein
LAVESSWKAEFRTKEAHHWVTRSAVRVERITVPAGEFECFAIKSTGRWNNDWFHNEGNVDESYWYAPQAKRIVRYEARWWGKQGVGRAIFADSKWNLAESRLA